MDQEARAGRPTECSVSTAAMSGSPDAAQGLSTPALAPTMRSGDPPIARTRASSGSAHPVTIPPTTNAAPTERLSPRAPSPIWPPIPPVFEIIESNETTVARCSLGTTWCRYAWRTGLVDAGGRRDQEERRERSPERGDEAEHDRGARLDGSGAEQERRAAAATAGEHVDELVPRDRRERDARRHEAGDPHGVAREQVEQVRLRGVERPHQEPELEERREHQQPERALGPAVRDALAGVAGDLGGQLGERDAAWREADVVHNGIGDREHGDEQPGPYEVGKREVDLAEEAAADRPHEHRRARDLLAAGEDGVERARVPGDREGVDEPRLHRPGVEREAEAHQDGHDGEGDDARVRPRQGRRRAAS